MAKRRPPSRPPKRSKKPSAPKRDAFGRFLPKKVTARKSAPPLRNVQGRFLNREQIAVREREELERLRDLVFRTPEQHAQEALVEQRRLSVKQEKQRRRQRQQRHPERYKHQRNPNKRTLDILNVINSGKAPPPDDSTSYGNGVREYVWTWQGEHAVETARRFLYAMVELQRAGDAPKDLQGYMAVGNGRGKNSVWIGTKFGSPRDIVRHSHTMFSSKSGNTQDLMALPQGERNPHIWAEVTLTTRGTL